MKKINILVTGSNGYLGKRLVELLDKKRFNVLCINRRKSDQITAQNIIYADISDAKSLKKVISSFQSVDVLIHLAAKVPKNNNEDILADLIRDNIVGTEHILNVIGKNLKHIIYASTIEVYGLSNNNLINEENLTNPLTYYGATKLAGEKICEVYGIKNLIPVTILRFSNIYGPHDYIDRAIPNFIQNSLKGDPLLVFGGEEMRDFVYIDDAVSAVKCALKTRKNGLYNIGSGKGISILKTARIISKKINNKPEIKILPRRKNKSDLVMNISKAKKNLGYIPKYTFPDKLDYIIKSYNPKALNRY